MEYLYLTLPNGEKIHYREQNPGSLKYQTIIFVHGNYSSLKWWDEVIDGVSDLGFRILALDLRGFGRSSYNNPCCRFQHWAADLVQFMKLMKVNKAILNGWSFGGAISQKAAQLAPEMVSKLILTCSVSHQGLVMKGSDGHALKTKEQISKQPKVEYALKTLGDKNEEGMRQIFDLLLYQKMPDYPEERKKRLALDPFDQRCYAELLEALANTDIDISKIKAKTLLIHGNEDNVLPLQTIMGTAERLGKLQLLEGRGHMVPLECPEKYLSIIREFMTSE